MQGKTKGFLEDTGVILVLAATIYGGYYGYTTFLSDSSDDTVKVESNVIIKHDINTTLNRIEKKQIEKKIVVKENNTSIVNKQAVINKIIKKELKPKVEPVKEKNVDLVMLRKFLRDVKFKMATNIVKRDDLNVTVSQSLRIRVTVLKDGSYEKLVFVGGDKTLFDMNKENILKVFPVYVDDKIKDDFPRYVRISIK